jgi:hypothetical protein
MAIGNIITIGVGTPSDITTLVLTGLDVPPAGSGVSAVDDDTSTALAKAIQALAAGSGSGVWMNERIREYLNTQYTTTATDIQANFARWLKDLKS